jgi:hypothetical protein
VKRSGAFFVTGISYDFLSVIHNVEPLCCRGRRLQETATQRQSKMYAADSFIRFEVEHARQRLTATFVEDGQLILSHGECQRMRLWLTNIGEEAIDDIWLVAGNEDELYVVGEEIDGKWLNNLSRFSLIKSRRTNHIRFRNFLRGGFIIGHCSTPT